MKKSTFSFSVQKKAERAPSFSGCSVRGWRGGGAGTEGAPQGDLLEADEAPDAPQPWRPRAPACVSVRPLESWTDPPEGRGHPPRVRFTGVPGRGPGGKKGQPGEGGDHAGAVFIGRLQYFGGGSSTSHACATTAGGRKRRDGEWAEKHGTLNLLQISPLRLGKGNIGNRRTEKDWKTGGNAGNAEFFGLCCFGSRRDVDVSKISFTISRK